MTQDVLAVLMANPLAWLMMVVGMAFGVGALRYRFERARDLRSLQPVRVSSREEEFEALRELDQEFPAALALPPSPVVVAADLVAPAPRRCMAEELLMLPLDEALRACGQPPLRQPPPLPAPAPRQIRTVLPPPRPSWMDSLSRKLLPPWKPERFAMGCGHSIPVESDASYCRRKECPFGVFEWSGSQALIRLWDGRVFDAGDYKEWCLGKADPEALKNYDTAGSWVPRVQPSACVFPLLPSDPDLDDQVEK